MARISFSHKSHFGQIRHTKILPRKFTHTQRGTIRLQLRELVEATMGYQGYRNLSNTPICTFISVGYLRWNCKLSHFIIQRKQNKALLRQNMFLDLHRSTQDSGIEKS